MSTNTAGSNYLFLMTSNNSVGGFANYHISTETSASIQDCNMIVEIDVVLGVNDYWLVRSQLNTSGWVKPQTYIQEIPQSYNVIQNTTENNYLNPPTNQMTYLSLKGGLTTTFYNAAANLWRMTLNNGSYPSVSGGSISLVYAPNTSSPSYISISKNALYEVSVVYNRVLIGSGSIAVSYFMEFYNITTSTTIARCRLVLNNTGGPNGFTGVINFIDNLSIADYDVRLTLGTNAAFSFADAFSIAIKEFIPLYA